MGRKSRKELHERGTVRSRAIGIELKKRRERVRREDREFINMTNGVEGLEQDGEIFVPRLLNEDELPDMPEPLRQLTNLTAEGKPTPDDLRKKLLNVNDPYWPEQLCNAIREGIRRWHTHGKERG